VDDSAAEARIDQALVARVQLNGDRAAFDQLIRRHQGMVRAQLRRLTHGDEATADDLAQEAFVLAWRKLDQFRGDARFSSWLYRISYTCFLQAQRNTVQHNTVDIETLPLQITDRHMDVHIDLRIDLERAMQHLSDAEQAVLLHCVQLGLSHEEAAYVLAMPLGTVKTHALRGKAKLKTWLAAWHNVTGMGTSTEKTL
jgi:RNA polymerase sigma factor (sigma-70 family)